MPVSLSFVDSVPSVLISMSAAQIEGRDYSFFPLQRALSLNLDAQMALEETDSARLVRLETLVASMAKTMQLVQERLLSSGALAATGVASKQQGMAGSRMGRVNVTFDGIPGPNTTMASSK